jgi:hypothetical protein
MLDAVGGGHVAAQTVARWSGRALDPAIAAIFQDAPDELLRISNPDDLWAAVVDAEPAPRRWNSPVWLIQNGTVPVNGVAFSSDQAC